MNGAPQKNHIRFIVLCVTLLGVISIVAGTILTFKGYNAELLIGGGVGTIPGLLGMLSTAKPTPPPPDVTVTNPPLKTEIKNNVSQPEPIEPKS